MAANRTDQDRIHPAAAVPEADLLEQQAPSDPALTDDHPDDGAATALCVDGADRWEQQLPVPATDDEYPHDDPDDGFEAG